MADSSVNLELRVVTMTPYAACIYIQYCTTCPSFFNKSWRLKEKQM